MGAKAEGLIQATPFRYLTGAMGEPAC